MTSIFSINRLNFLNKLKKLTLKVPSFDCASFKMIEKLSKTNKKIIISTGGTYDREIEKTANILKKNKKVLHIFTAFPFIPHLLMRQIYQD